MINTIMPSHKGFLYHTLALSFCLGVRLYTNPISSSLGLGLVNVLISAVMMKQTIKAMPACTSQANNDLRG